MILEKFTRISKFTGRITVRRLDSFLTATSSSHKIYNSNCFCIKQFTNNSYNQTRYLSVFSDVRCMQAEAKTLPKDNVFTEQLLVGNTLLESSDAFVNCVPAPMEFNESLAIHNEEELLGKPWINMSNSEIVENFEILSHHAFKHEASIEDEKFGSILEVIKTKCTDFSDSDIRHLFKCLQLWSPDKNGKAFIAFWQALEDEIVKRFTDWTIDEILLTCHLYYKLRISRSSEFTWHSLKKIGRKPQHMSYPQLIHFAFLMKMNRRLPINVYNIEYYIEQQVDKLSLNELAICAMAFSQYETPIRSPKFIEKFIDKLIAGIDTANEISLNAIINVIRLHKTTNEKYMNLLQELERVVPRLSIPVLGNIAASMKKTLMHSESLVAKIAERFESDIKNVKMKQMDQLMFLLFTFGYNGKTTPFCSAAMRELLDPDRAAEVEKFPKLFVGMTRYTLSMNHSSKELEEVCKKMFDREFVDKYCKNDYYMLTSEYLEASYCLELDQPEYNGPKLDQEVLNFLCKSYGSYKNQSTIRRSESKTLDGVILNDIERICQQALNSESAFYRDAVLPHFSKAFGIICYDPETKEFGTPADKLSEIPYSSIKYAPDDGKKWFALVTASIHQVINNTRKPVGKVLLQMRHLEKIGYEPILIPYYKWETMSTDEEKKNYILELLHR